MTLGNYYYSQQVSQVNNTEINGERYNAIKNKQILHSKQISNDTDTERNNHRQPIYIKQKATNQSRIQARIKSNNNNTKGVN